MYFFQSNYITNMVHVYYCNNDTFNSNHNLKPSEINYTKSMIVFYDGSYFHRKHLLPHLEDDGCNFLDDDEMRRAFSGFTYYNEYYEMNFLMC